MIDVHAHITSRNFGAQAFQEVLQSAKESGVQHIISVSETVHDASDVLTLASQSNGMIWPSLGLHPVQYLDGDNTSERSVTKDDWDKFKPILEKAIKDRTIVCVGEIGLDFSRHIIQQNPNNMVNDESELRQMQCDIFREQVEMAVKANLPVNVHSRSAGHYALNVLYECGARLVNMHAFDGKASYTKKAVEQGFYFSIPPSIIRSPQKEILAKVIPMKCLLLESDSPALAPEKGMNNEPKYIKVAAQEIARIKNIPVEKVIAQTTMNAIRLFKDHHQACLE
ncbi:putative deoxyribonuclease TATDN3 [Halteromyces radiatus]|uniref:putative deoxyribonuclease TATDN3 n=1 Tax=Halteromyces radiatus TaxID=101107 RepID=UPI00221FBB23|nr:putative deoxyribonuclease TATDN3 [Halteromyces radiatus]KAI8088849.1 putative deoxyribonuclease TATDN3 [Halteromyces radiatus]